MIEPSAAERSEWPDATRAYVEALETRLDELESAISQCTKEDLESMGLWPPKKS